LYNSKKNSNFAGYTYGACYARTRMEYYMCA
jgi:hypothetical protein